MRFKEYIESKNSFQNTGVPHYADQNTPAIRPTYDDPVQRSMSAIQNFQKIHKPTVEVGTRFRWAKGLNKMFGDEVGIVTKVGKSNISYKMPSDPRTRTTSISNFNPKYNSVEILEGVNQ